MRPGRIGFTLLEVVLVMVVMLLATAIAIPYLDALRDDINLTGAADKVRGCWAEARVRAIEDGKPYKFGIVPGQDRFRYAPDGTGQDDPAPVEDSLPKGITFSLDRGDLPSDGDGFTTLVTFQATGEASDDVEVTLASPSLQPIVLRLRALTGAVSTRRGG
jgi:type II secretory pathway pseudopilin PulG